MFWEQPAYPVKEGTKRKMKEETLILNTVELIDLILLLGGRNTEDLSFQGREASKVPLLKTASQFSQCMI